MYILQVTPILKLPNNIYQSLTFSHTQHIPIGSLVLVKVRQKLIPGIVIKSETQQKKETKDFTPNPIEEVLSPTPLLNANQLKLIFWISTFYSYSAGIVLKLFLPKIPKTIKRYPKILAPEHPILPNDKTTHFVSSLAMPFEERVKFYRTFLKTKSDSQTLFLCPDIPSQDILFAELKAVFGDQVTLINSTLTTTQFRQNWMKVAVNEVKIIVSTRIGLFLPFAKLADIFVEEASSPAYYSNDMKPKYRTQRIAVELADLHHADLRFCADFPTVDNLFWMKKHQTSPIIVPPKTKPKFKMVNVLALLQSKADDFLDISIHDAIAKALENDRPVILFLNRRGHSTFVQCQDCGWIARCKHCEYTLVEHQADVLRKKNPSFRGNALLCHRCGRWYKSITQCPKCRSHQLDFRGMGVEKIAEKIKLFYPNSVPSILDTDRAQTFEDQQKIWTKSFSTPKSILITTQMFAKFLFAPLPKDPIIVVLNTENIFVFPSYSSIEEATFLFQKILSRSHQTFFQFFSDKTSEEDYVSQTLQQILITPSLTIDQQLQHRSLFKYPPYSQIIALHSMHKTKPAAMEQAIRTKTVLTGIGIDTLGPLEGYTKRGRGMFMFTLVIREQEQKAEKLKQRLSAILERGQEIEIDPELPL
jgi:primosomal protein N' (replication factor Y)